MPLFIDVNDNNYLILHRNFPRFYKDEIMSMRMK